jgi:4-aminobutyrate aminotransferase
MTSHSDEVVQFPDDAAALLERHRKVIPSWIALYYDEPIELVKGEGTRVWDSSGKEYLDFFGGIVTTISGHAVEELVKALQDQAGKIAHTSTLYLIRPMIELAEKLTGSAPIDGDTKAFFVGSGTEAIEAALLFATTWRRSNQIIALRNSYHGRSFGAMGITGNRGWSASGLTPVNVSYAMPAYCYRCPLHLTYPSCGVACAEDVRNVIETTTSGDVAAMIAEPIQGVGGFVTPPPEYFSIVKGILDEFEIPFIADEVQTGFGRTGDTYWGIEGYGVEPDAMVMAKGLGNGMAMGAIVGRTEMVDSIKANSISTFGGNPLSTVTALANLQNIEDNDLQHNAQRVGKMLKDGLNDIKERHDIVGDVRGKGLMLGIELVRDADTREPGPDLAGKVLEGAKDRGLLIGKGGLYGSVVRMSPPLSITEEDAARAIETIEAAVVDAKV